MNIDYYDGVIHFNYSNQKQVAMAFCRIQEFYESDKDDLRGNVFTFEQFIDYYTDDTGKFDYFSSWGGYNVPGHVVDEFFDRFKDLTERELEIQKAVNQLNRDRYYIIGTSVDRSDAIEHELVHAHYYLNNTYHHAVNTLIDSMDYDLRKKMMTCLKNMGYTDDVIEDEINAYLATSTMKYLKDKVKLNVKKSQVEPFRELSKTVLG